MCGGGVGVAEGVSPDAVFAADAVDDAFAGERVEGAVDGDGVGLRGEFFEDFDSAEGARGVGEDVEDAGADGGAAEFCLEEEAVDDAVAGGMIGVGSPHGVILAVG